MALNIAVIGAGVIGLTSAYQILESIPNARITIIAEKFSPDTTSDVSAGYWEPYCLDESSGQGQLILKWGKETYDEMMKIALSENANKCGVQSLSAIVIQDQKHLKTPYWSKIVANFSALNMNDINNVVVNTDGKYKGGFQFLTTTCVVSRYLSFLSAELKKRRVVFVRKKLVTLSQFIDDEGRKYDYIINCSGLGSREFVPDTNVFATKGQVIRAKAPWIKSCLMIESDEIIYILPLSDLIVIGGSQEENVYNFDTDRCDRILKRCQETFPFLKDAEVVSKHAGHRPSRKGGIRLEMETCAKAKVIHNYGHGGSGVTLCWGCANDVVEIIRRDIEDDRRLKSKL